MDALSLVKAAVMGLIEGATEFIPVSSTGHLILAKDWLNFNGANTNAFVIFIQLGAILAVIWLYREKCLRVALNWTKDPEARRLIINLIVGTIPAAVIGLPTDTWIEAHLFKPFPVALALVAGGLAILLIERSSNNVNVTDVDHIPVKKALGIGLIQVLAILFPGVSRSGATIMGGLVLGLSRTAATEFSFFLAIPAMFGASLIKLIEARHCLTLADMPVFTIGFVVSFVSAAMVIRGLIAFVSHRSFIPFAWYRIALGSVLVATYYKL
ncbi:Undecaprenyl-diphosphatase [uncultured Desulfobacterium sp.]|uniref:Undecaprenyl-diphosphatase n=1 Tax=uncultured Desulfobacterium sp. TaxID=201089 RepID=A0A445MW73_9BACT|nr:Undecaprenyl-diphosphatase [uncultured Desulfobacterium sp.]